MRQKTPLEQLYENLKAEYQKEITLYHSDVYYVRAALQDNPKVPPEIRKAAQGLTLEQMRKILWEEGLLPYYEYKIPRWYARKWLGEGGSKKKAPRIVAT